VIVGFPTETDAEFEDTLSVMREVRFDSAFTFKYSERKGTIASKKYPDDVPEAVKTKRIMRLTDLQKQISYEKNLAHVGETHTVLVESLATARSCDECQGRTDGNKLVILPAPPIGGAGRPYKVGDMLKVRITHATPHALRGGPFGV
ncbi:MAG: TRAM domain-containing protein, partial [Candidatus Omnitrophica bacterium]|nr:TRAM domain-containing protein [Candidatus Omnitrophota bacterium]